MRAEAFAKQSAAPKSLGVCQNLSCKRPIHFLHRCDNCKVAEYCKPYCATLDWGRHGARCRDLTDPPRQFWRCAHTRCQQMIHNRNYVSGAQYDAMKPEQRMCPFCYTVAGTTTPPPGQHQILFNKLFDTGPNLVTLTRISDSLNTGLLKDILPLIAAYCSHAVIDQWIDIRVLGYNSSTGASHNEWVFAHIDQIEIGCYPVTRFNQPINELFALHTFTDRESWQPNTTPAVTPTPDKPVYASRIHFNELSVYDYHYMIDNPGKPDQFTHKVINTNTSSCPGGVVGPVKPYVKNPPRREWGIFTYDKEWKDLSAYEKLLRADHDGVWFVISDSDDGINQIEIAPYQSKVKRPEPPTCFVNGQVMMADGAWRDVWAVKTGDQIRAPILEEEDGAVAASLTTITAADLPFTVQTVLDVNVAEAADDFRVVSFGGGGTPPLQLTRGHPIFVPSTANGKFDWMRPDEVGTPIRQFVQRVCNFVLSRGGSHTVIARGDSGSGTGNSGGTKSDFVICSTIGADCGSRLAAEHPAYHSKYGPSQRR